MSRRSIARTLSRGLLGVGLAGLLVLLAVILLDYHITFSALREPRAFQRAAFEVATHVLLPALVIALPMALVGRRIVQRAVRPIEMAAQAVADVPSVQFGVRIDGSEFPAEIAPLAEGVNGLLTRMEAIAEGNAAFAADVAHELRTPLTLLGLELERLDHPQAGPLQAQVHDMQKLVNQLMMIARLDAQELRREASQPVDLGMVCAGTVEQMAPKALQVGRFLGFDDLGAAPVLAEAKSLGAALRNLVDNALRVTPEGGSVTVIAGPGPKIGVADGGPGLTQAELERLSHPHVRADHASSDGAGLGLSIVRKIADQFGGRLVSDVQLKRISIEFPPAPATARQGDVSNTG